MEWLKNDPMVETWCCAWFKGWRKVVGFGKRVKGTKEINAEENEMNDSLYVLDSLLLLCVDATMEHHYPLSC